MYPYSVVPGGVEDAKELKWVAEHDPIVAATAMPELTTTTLGSYVSPWPERHMFRTESATGVYWTHHRVTLPPGEKVITDGRITARSRCGNRVEEVPQGLATASAGAPGGEGRSIQPVRMPIGTATQAPAVPFQSALLNRPVAPGVGSMGPLSLYDPLGGGGWTPISPPPLPVGLCGPGKKKGSTDAGCCAGEVSEGKKKPGSPCGAPGVVPEPGTWVLFASGLVLIFWQSRRKLMRAQ